MTQVTGTPIGNVISQADLYLEGAPDLYYQQYEQAELFAPDSDGFYWNLSGSTAHPVIALGCIEGLTLADNLTMNDVMCDTVGVKNTIMRRNYLELTVNIQTQLPLSTVRHILHGGAVTVSGNTEKMGLGPINQNRFFHIWMPKVYDEDFGEFVGFQLHRARFTGPWTIAFRYGNAWQIQGIKLRAYADTTLPSPQSFATVIRSDSQHLP